MMGQIFAFHLAGVPCIAALSSDFSNQVANFGSSDVLVVVSSSHYNRGRGAVRQAERRPGHRLLRPQGLAAGDVLIPVPSEALLFSFSLTSLAALPHASPARMDRAGGLDPSILRELQGVPGARTHAIAYTNGETELRERDLAAARIDNQPHAVAPGEIDVLASPAA